jgi:hypothetical protein
MWDWVIKLKRSWWRWISPLLKEHHPSMEVTAYCREFVYFFFVVFYFPFFTLRGIPATWTHSTDIQLCVVVELHLKSLSSAHSSLLLFDPWILLQSTKPTKLSVSQQKSDDSPSNDWQSHTIPFRFYFTIINVPLVFESQLNECSHTKIHHRCWIFQAIYIAMVVAKN